MHLYKYIAHYTFDSVAVRICWVPIDKEFVGSIGEIWWHPCTKAKDGEEFVGVVFLDDVNDGLNGLYVLVWVTRVVVMEGRG